MGSQKTLGELAEYLEAELIGDAECKVERLATIQSASENDLAFLSQGRYKKDLISCRAAAVLLKPEDANAFSGNKIIVEDPYFAYGKVSRLFEELSAISPGVHKTAVVADSAKVPSSACISANCVIGENVTIGENVRLYPGVVIGDGSSLGDDTLLHANVTVYHGVEVGQRCIIHSGTVLGSDGFGFAPAKGCWNKIHQLGGVVIGDDVEIGSNTSIDRGALENTEIASGVIIDNLVHIAHNVKVGAGTAIAGCVGIAGSTTIGKNCTVAGAVAINGHIEIADNSHFNGGTIVTKGNSEAGIFASAPPLQDVKKWRRNSVRYTQLDELTNRIRALEKQIKLLESK